VTTPNLAALAVRQRERVSFAKYVATLRLERTNRFPSILQQRVPAGNGGDSHAMAAAVRQDGCRRQDKKSQAETLGTTRGASASFARLKPQCTRWVPRCIGVRCTVQRVYGSRGVQQLRP
jgi:hypothetical protein